MSKIGCQVEGLVDVSEDGLRAMSSGIRSERFGITPKRSYVVGDQHGIEQYVEEKDDAPEVWTKYQMNR